MIEILIRTCLLTSKALTLENIRLFLKSSFSEEPDGTYTPHNFEIQMPYCIGDSDRVVSLPKPAIVPVTLLGVENFKISCCAQIAEFQANSGKSELYLLPTSAKIRRSNRSTHLSIQLKMRRTTVPEGVQRIVDNLSKVTFVRCPQDRGLKPRNVP
ncbi:MAG TPA: hypothetical protein DCE71_07970 [Parachlamydiales bacterium]|jgi:hypothetical protein|nr:hypothetical protein [Parachlamydiales bacterium]